jgi:tRNA splicing ligase
MKHVLASLVLLLAVSVLVAGCGKTEEMKKMESSLNAEIMQKHDDLMKTMSGLDDLTAQITAAMTKHDEMVKKYPRLVAGHESSDLVAAQEKITAAKTAMENWMKGFKPFDLDAKHEDVLASMTVTKDALTAMEKQFNEAMGTAKEALAAHEKAAEMVMAKTSKKKR